MWPWYGVHINVWHSLFVWFVSHAVHSLSHPYIIAANCSETSGTVPDLLAICPVSHTEVATYFVPETRMTRSLYLLTHAIQVKSSQI